jgi:hypothetical protein
MCQMQLRPFAGKRCPKKHSHSQSLRNMCRWSGAYFQLITSVNVTIAKLHLHNLKHCIAWVRSSICQHMTSVPFSLVFPLVPFSSVHPKPHAARAPADHKQGTLLLPADKAGRQAQQADIGGTTGAPLGVSCNAKKLLLQLLPPRRDNPCLS